MTPTQTFVATAQTTHDVLDANGRTLTFRKLGALDRLRLFKAAPGQAYNERYLGLAYLAFTVIAIDGVPVPQPTNEQQIEAAIDRIGDAGIEAIGDAFKHQEPADATPGN